MNPGGEDGGGVGPMPRVPIARRMYFFVTGDPTTSLSPDGGVEGFLAVLAHEEALGNTSVVRVGLESHREGRANLARL